MKIIYNKVLPFGNYIAINLFGVIFAKKQLKQTTINHESIHTEQMKEMLYVFFYIWYVIEFLINLFLYGNWDIAYMNIKFEKEAYLFQNDLNYIKNRKRYNWLKL